MAAPNRFAIPPGVDLVIRGYGEGPRAYLAPLDRAVLMCEGPCDRLSGHRPAEIDIGPAVFECEQCGTHRKWG